MQITDPQYRFPQFSARRFIRPLSNGATEPLLFGCRNLVTGESAECVVKLLAAPHMSVEAFAREVLAAFIAMQWGIKVVEPVTVEITPAFVALELGQPHYSVLSSSIGVNYGSVYLPGYETIPVHQPLNEAELRQAQDIVLFDLITQNPDRRMEKPNLMSNGKELVVYDHEKAFSFAMALFPNRTPEQLQAADRAWIQNLFLIPKIRQGIFPDSECQVCIERLDDEFWQHALSFIPTAWQTPQLTTIRTYIEAIVRNAALFIQSTKAFL